MLICTLKAKIAELEAKLQTVKDEAAEMMKKVQGIVDGVEKQVKDVQDEFTSSIKNATA
jgi:hypothetical protein